LEHLHSKNIIYRDVKPDNLLISAHPRIKLADFGNVHFLSANESSIKGMEGTTSYMSPEMRMGRYYDQRTDIWSFGITVLNVLFDSPDFETMGAKKFAEEYCYGSEEATNFITTLFLKARERPSATKLLDVYRTLVVLMVAPVYSEGE
jgi:serine/threonine protein kinase